MDGGGFYHDRHMAMLSTDHMRNIGSKAEYASIAKGNVKARRFGDCRMGDSCLVMAIRIQNHFFKLINWVQFLRKIINNWIL